MPIVEVSEIVIASVEESYGLICDPEKYSQLMTGIHSVQVLEHNPRGAKTSWIMDVEGLKFKWEQLDEYCLEDKTLHFSQIKGDMLKFEGKWSFSKTPEGTKVSLYLDVDPGIPMLGLFHYILMKRVQEVVQGMVKGFKELVETSPIISRRFPPRIANDINYISTKEI